MAKDIFYTGIDLGTSKVTTLVARVGAEGEPQVLGLGVAPSQGMEKGVVVDVREAGKAIGASVDEARRYVGRALSPAHVSISGAYTSSMTTTGVLDDNGGAMLLSREQVRDLVRASYPSLEPGTELLHVIPRDFVIDGLRGIRNPVGLKASEARVETSVVVGESAALKKVRRAVEKGGVTVHSLVLSTLATGYAVLTEDEKEMGVVLVDMGAGTTDIAIFKGGSLWHSACIPVGGYHASRDLSVALGIPYEYAEEAKLRWGCAIPDMVEASEEVLVPAFGAGSRQTVKRREMCEPIYDRLLETVRLIILKLRQAGLERLPTAGMVFVGGAAAMPGMQELVKRIVPGPVRIGIPTAAPGLPPEVRDPAFSAGVGILLWSMRHHGERRAYRSQRRVLATYNAAFRRLRTTTGSQWKETCQRLSTEFKKIYA